jgi:hypothetical protein
MSDSLVSAASVPDPVPLPPPLSARDLWIDRFRRFHAANLSITEFCQAEGVATQAFYYWRNVRARRITGLTAASACRGRPPHGPWRLPMSDPVVYADPLSEPAPLPAPPSLRVISGATEAVASRVN